MTFQQLKYAVMIADTGTFSEAAEKLYISQPSLSNAIRELEKEIGIHIFKRSRKGISVSAEGGEFLAHARQIMMQMQMVEDKFVRLETSKLRFAVSTQHYEFAAIAFLDMMKEIAADKYELTIRETTTIEVIEDVSTRKSELGILYLSKENNAAIEKMLKERNMEFTQLITTKPHVILGRQHPLAAKQKITIPELYPYPYISFEQKINNSFYFSEEIFSNRYVDKSIKISERAVAISLMESTDSYTIATGILLGKSDTRSIISIPLDSEEIIRVGIVHIKGIAFSEAAMTFLRVMNKYIA